MANMVDAFSSDVFDVVQTTAAINELDWVPGRAGTLAFEGVGEGVATTSVTIESLPEGLKLIPTSLRGAPAPVETKDKRSMLKLDIPFIQLTDSIFADSIQNVRAFGSNELESADSVINKQMEKMNLRLDLTLEHHRLGALRGVIKDADGSTLCDLFSEFGFLNSDGIAAAEEFEFSLDNYGAVGVGNAIRIQCQAVKRYMKRQAKTNIPANAKIWAFCGDNFFDKLLEHPSVRSTYDGYGAAQAALGGNYTFDIFEYGGVFWENYQGTDDNSTVIIAPDECRFFLSGVPGLYVEYYAPADFIPQANTIGLPRYASVQDDNNHGRSVSILVESAPLPLCLRPQTLCRGVIAEAPSA
ncbi:MULTISPECIES: major capsid protein [unclassified Nitrobacter]|uniref:major capsid protein n=1 Tax=unclassified Nitrobacter TaxID=2620411 RepID=UPI001ACE95DB|nr:MULTISPECIES: major capsid protein [unclassified Nitrobacter]MBN9149154.1 major capsid protein [Nitrobacter sp.]